ncbi:MAG: endonuclease VII domain-containing protein [Candidatus Vogelbacteria bacterium]|nr:endonuclease VII domain-containing protein [Candidatus Vogelbacteria bacterium]
MSREDKLAWLKKKPANEPFECPICKKKTIAGVTSKVVLEHDHHTGKTGGWICDSCNTGLGRFKDDVELLKSAIEFLKKNY